MLSVIIATSESERALLATLASLVGGAAAGAVREVIVVDANSQDDTAQVGEVAGCLVLTSSGPLGARLKEGAAAARADWLLFMRPGAVLANDWVEETSRFMTDAGEHNPQAGARAAVFRPALPHGAQRPLLLDAWSLFQAALRRWPRPDQGLLIAKDLYEAEGGHRAEDTDAEMELIRRIGRRRIVMLRNASIRAPL